MQPPRTSLLPLIGLVAPSEIVLGGERALDRAWRAYEHRAAAGWFRSRAVSRDSSADQDDEFTPTASWFHLLADHEDDLARHPNCPAAFDLPPRPSLLPTLPCLGPRINPDDAKCGSPGALRIRWTSEVAGVERSAHSGPQFRQPRGSLSSPPTTATPRQGSDFPATGNDSVEGKGQDDRITGLGNQPPSFIDAPVEQRD